ncbi:hypothetical protein N7453_000958 [Penicillium expansum]|nr:hypothetical protein N7453_000958 [Penicillium expansum]
MTSFQLAVNAKEPAIESLPLKLLQGAYSGNGRANPKAGCSFVYRNSILEHQIRSYTNFALGKEGPTGIKHPHTSNRAELRAVIAATQSQYWVAEGCRCLVIATDLEYVVKGMTQWAKGWVRKDWKTKVGAPVKNQDLWRCLLGEVERWDEEGMRIQFYRIPRGLNTKADRYAKEATSKRVSQEFRGPFGILV